jgi:serine/threonine-protein kinase
VLIAVAAGALALSPIKVPSVVGLKRQAAASMVSDKGLKVSYGRAFSDQDEDTVIATRPAPGARIRRGGTVRMVVSAGPELTDAPALVGMTIAEATLAIEANGLELGQVERRHDLAIKDKVLDQDPKPGRSRKGDPVDLVVSDGPQILEVPDAMNRPVAEAEAIVRQWGFTAVREQVYSPASEGTVVDQSPKPPEKVPQGTPVKLMVSKGTQPFAMPNTKGRTCSDAKSQLESLGLRVSIQSPTGGSAACGGNKVLEQDPLPETNVRGGREATLYVSG